MAAEDVPGGRRRAELAVQDVFLEDRGQGAPTKPVRQRVALSRLLLPGHGLRVGSLAASGCLGAHVLSGRNRALRCALPGPAGRNQTPGCRGLCRAR